MTNLSNLERILYPVWEKVAAFFSEGCTPSKVAIVSIQTIPLAELYHTYKLSRNMSDQSINVAKSPKVVVFDLE